MRWESSVRNKIPRKPTNTNFRLECLKMINPANDFVLSFPSHDKRHSIFGGGSSSPQIFGTHHVCNVFYLPQNKYINVRKFGTKKKQQQPEAIATSF